MIWLVGDRGLLGTEVALALDAAGLEFAGTGREVDITDPKALGGFAAGKDIGWIVNCAGYAAVDEAEGEGELAWRLNAEAPENLARTAHSCGARLLHVSTDYVFDGAGVRPYLEDDPVAPLGARRRPARLGSGRRTWPARSRPCCGRP
jgi:dTDP-4-dehydrorhamnose reductase